MAIGLEITVGLGAALDGFDAQLFRDSYWRFIRLTSLKEKQAAQALAGLLEMRELDLHALNKALRPWFEDAVEGSFWKDPDFELERVTNRGVAPVTRIQEIDFIVRAIVGRYSFYSQLYRKIEQFKYAGFKPIAAVDVRHDCKLHSPDSWKLVNPIAYMQKKPMRESIDCYCWLDWAPASKRLYGKWKARIAKYKAECQNTR